MDVADESVAAAVGRFYAAHRQELFSYAVALTRSQACAEDAVHEAIRSLLSLRRLPGELRPYVFRCVRNAAIDLGRAAARERRKLDDYTVLFEGPAESRGLEEEAAAFLAALGEREREIVVLKIFSGLSFREIAAVCRAPQGTVAASYWRSLQKLRERAPQIGIGKNALESTP